MDRFVYFSKILRLTGCLLKVLRWNILLKVCSTTVVLLENYNMYKISCCTLSLIKMNHQKTHYLHQHTESKAG